MNYLELLKAQQEGQNQLGMPSVSYADLLKQRQSNINQLQGQLEETQAKEIPFLQKVDLKPIMGLVDSLYGTRIAQSYTPPTDQLRKERDVAQLRDAIGKQEAGLVDDQYNFTRLLAEDERARELASQRLEDKESDRQMKLLLASMKGGKGAGPNGGPGMTKGMEALDKAFAKTYEQDFISGRIASAEKNLDQLNNVSNMLENRTDLTGGLVGNAPMMVRRRFYQDSADAQQTVEDVVQQSLKAILGAQFTEKEAARLIERAYDPALDEAKNKTRVDRLLKALRKGIASKKAAGEYFEKNGTLSGFNGTMFSSVDDIISEMDSSGAPSMSAQAGMVRVTNGQETLVIPEADLNDAIKDGYRQVK